MNLSFNHFSPQHRSQQTAGVSQKINQYNTINLAHMDILLPLRIYKLHFFNVLIHIIYKIKFLFIRKDSERQMKNVKIETQHKTSRQEPEVNERV
jgi:hypothetical protein